MSWKYKTEFIDSLKDKRKEPKNYYDLYDYKNWLEEEVTRLRGLANGDKRHTQCVSSRFNLVSDVMPARNEYVLIKTPYCKYPATVGFWNGVKWLASDDKCEIFNVSEWLSLK